MNPCFRMLTGWRDPTHVAQRFKDAFTFGGFSDLTSHVLRKTVASVLDEAGLSAKETWMQLEHTSTATTQEHYISRHGPTTTAEVSESFAL